MMHYIFLNVISFFWSEKCPTWERSDQLAEMVFVGPCRLKITLYNRAASLTKGPWSDVQEKQLLERWGSLS